jgi:hypothetical protein
VHHRPVAGLSYTSFSLHSLAITPNRTTANGTFSLALVATNTGEVDSAVPVQVFFRDPVCYPVRIASIQLVRFAKVFLRAGESKHITIGLSARDLGFWDDGRNGNNEVGPEGGWVVDPGVFNLVIGTAGFTSWRQPQGLLGAASVASFQAAILTEIYLCNVCSCQEILRRNGRGQETLRSWRRDLNGVVPVRREGAGKG